MRLLPLKSEADFARLDDGGTTGQACRRQSPIYPPPHLMSWLSAANLPQPHDRQRLDVAWTRGSEKAGQPETENARALLEALFGNGPYLTETALQDPGLVATLWRQAPTPLAGSCRDWQRSGLARAGGTSEAAPACGG